MAAAVPSCAVVIGGPSPGSIFAHTRWSCEGACSPPRSRDGRSHQRRPRTRPPKTIQHNPLPSCSSCAGCTHWRHRSRTRWPC